MGTARPTTRILEGIRFNLYMFILGRSARLAKYLAIRPVTKRNQRNCARL